MLQKETHNLQVGGNILDHMYVPGCTLCCIKYKCNPRSVHEKILMHISSEDC